MPRVLKNSILMIDHSMPALNRTSKNGTQLIILLSPNAIRMLKFKTNELKLHGLNPFRGLHRRDQTLLWILGAYKKGLIQCICSYKLSNWFDTVLFGFSHSEGIMVQTEQLFKDGVYLPNPTNKHEQWSDF